MQLPDQTSEHKGTTIIEDTLAQHFDLQHIILKNSCLVIMFL